MYLVKTKSQLMEAVRESAREIMVLGGWDPKKVELTSRSPKKSNREIPEDFSFTKLLNDFYIFSIYDRNQKLIATVFQHRNE